LGNKEKIKKVQIIQKKLYEFYLIPIFENEIYNYQNLNPENSINGPNESFDIFCLSAYFLGFLLVA